MEVYPGKMDGAHHICYDEVYCPFFRGIPPSTKNYYSHSLDNCVTLTLSFVLNNSFKNENLHRFHVMFIYKILHNDSLQVTFQMISTFVTLIPIVDCSEAIHIRENLTEVCITVLDHAPSQNLYVLPDLSTNTAIVTYDMKLMESFHFCCTLLNFINIVRFYFCTLVNKLYSVLHRSFAASQAKCHILALHLCLSVCLSVHPSVHLSRFAFSGIICRTLVRAENDKALDFDLYT